MLHSYRDFCPSLSFLVGGLHSVCCLLQPQPAALAHRAFGIFRESFLEDVELEDEPARILSILADEMAGAMAGHFGVVSKVPKSTALIERDRKLDMKGDHVMSSNLTAALKTI